MGHKKKRAKAKKEAIIFVVVVLVLLFSLPRLWALKKELSLYKVTFKTVSGEITPEFKLEAANSLRLRARGLMFRREMKEDHGMIFIFPEVSDHSFWMKNTFIPLDMLFLDDDFRVVGLLENVPILNSEQRKVGVPSRYVIELNAGAAKKSGITKGAKAEFKRSLPAAE